MNTKKDIEKALEKITIEFEGKKKILLDKISEVERERKLETAKKLVAKTSIPNPKSKGLGDTIKKVTNALGIKQCGGCKRRQDKLNRLIPYKEEPKKDK
jgi:hypothetical protein